jgi:hypothetical protein
MSPLEQAHANALVMVLAEMDVRAAKTVCAEADLGIQRAGSPPELAVWRDTTSFRRLGAKLGVVEFKLQLANATAIDGWNVHHAKTPLTKGYEGLAKVFKKLVDHGYRDSDVAVLLAQADKRPVTSLQQLEQDLFEIAERAGMPRHEEALTRFPVGDADRKLFSDAYGREFISALKLNNTRWLTERQVPPELHHALGTLTFGIAMEKAHAGVRARDHSTLAGPEFMKSMNSLSEAQGAAVEQYEALRKSGLDDQQILQALEAQARSTVDGLGLSNHITWRFEAILGPLPAAGGETSTIPAT